MSSVESEAFVPQFLEEAEALVGPFLVEDDINLNAIEHGFKRFAYRACCRVLASARADDRALAVSEVGYETKTWNDNWELTPRKIAEIAFRYQPEAAFISRQLAMVNGAAQYVEQNWEDMKAELYPDQLAYMLDIVDSLQKPPRTVTFCDDLGQPQRVDVLGVTVVAPTGFGKTRLMEACCRMLSAGKPFKGARVDGERPGRVTWVSPSLIIQEQTVKRLNEAFPDLTIGTMSADKKEPAADIVVSTIEMFNVAFENGHIAGYPVDTLVIDEDHHLTEPQFRKTFLEQWRGVTLGFTATPAYDLTRDVRNIIPHVVEQTDILTLIEKGRLNNGQIFTFSIDQAVYDTLQERYGITAEDHKTPDILRDVVDTLVIEFVEPLLNEGRRGIIFCDQGGQAFYARRLAERLSLLELPNKEPVIAQAMDSYAANQKQVIQDYKKGDVHVITTVDTGREGLDADIDFVIINTNIVSRLRGHQIVGRGPRKSEQFPVTVYAQFVNHLKSPTQFERLYSIEEAFGEATYFEQGRVLRSSVLDTTAPSALRMTEMPDIVQDLLQQIDRKPIGETFTSRVSNRGAWQVAEGMIPLSTILEGYDTTEVIARRMLRQAGFEWRGQYETHEGKNRLAYYYRPEAQDYLHKVLPKGLVKTKFELPGYFGVSRAVIDDALSELAGQIEVKVVSRGKGRPRTCYDEVQLTKIAEALKKVPAAQSESTVPELASLLGIDEDVVKRMAGVKGEKRRRVAGRYPLTAQEVAKVKAEFFSAPEAEPDEMTLVHIAEAAGIDHQVVKRNMTSEEYALGVEKRYIDKRGFQRRAPVWPAKIANEVIVRMERFKAKKLPAHMLPTHKLRKLIRKFGVTAASDIKQTLADGGFEPQELLIEGARSMSYCLSWQAIAYLESVMGRNKGKEVLQLDFNRLPSGPEDLEPAKIAYAQEVQRQLGFSAAQQERYEV